MLVWQRIGRPPCSTDGGDREAPGRAALGSLSPVTFAASSTGVALLNFHKTWAWFVIIGNGLAGIWALGANYLPALRTRALWWFIGLAELTVFVQVTLGTILVSKYKLVFPKFHAFYGFVAIIAVAIIYSYRYQMKHRLYLLYGLGSLFIMGLGIRAMLVGEGR